MFECDNPDGTDQRTWKERISEGTIILAAIGLVLCGLILHALRYAVTKR